MKNIILILLLFIAFQSCATRKPSDWKMSIDGKPTGLNNFINLNGFYITEGKCGNNSRDAFLFYNNGIFLNIIISEKENFIDISKEYFLGMDSLSYVSWGAYKIVDSTIIAQQITNPGKFLQSFALNLKFHLIPNEKIIFETYYNKAENTCKTSLDFYPLDTIISYEKCPYINKNWFIKNK